MSEKKLPSVREHAEALRDNLVKTGQIAPDPEAAVKAAGIPTFSAGTATLDPNTGKPVTLKSATPTTPSFTDGKVDLPAEASVTSAPLPDASSPEPEKPVAAASASKAAGTEAAEEAAQAVADDFAEYEEIEVEDADLDLKYPIRVPKQYATSAKRGYPRRAMFDRTVNNYKTADPVLRELIESGSINQILPLIQRALNDRTYGDYVWNGFQRANQGLPLIEQAKREAASAGAPPLPDATNPALEFSNDPWLAESLKPVVSELTELRTWRQQQADQQAEQQRRVAEAERARSESATQINWALEDLKRAYPAEYTGDFTRDRDRWQRTMQYAQESGYIGAYGVRAGIVFAAQQIHQMDQERLVATASPVAAALAQAEAQHMNLARQQAAASARTVGSGAPTQAPPPRPPVRPSTRNADGSMKPSDQYMREMQTYLVATRA